MHRLRINSLPRSRALQVTSWIRGADLTMGRIVINPGNHRRADLMYLINVLPAVTADFPIQLWCHRDLAEIESRWVCMRKENGYAGS